MEVVRVSNTKLGTKPAKDVEEMYHTKGTTSLTHPKHTQGYTMVVGGEKWITQIRTNKFVYCQMW